MNNSFCEEVAVRQGLRQDLRHNLRQDTTTLRHTLTEGNAPAFPAADTPERVVADDGVLGVVQP